MKKIPFNYIIALENPKAVVKTKEGNLVTNLRCNSIWEDPYLLSGHIKYENNQCSYCKAKWTLNGSFNKNGFFQELDLELYVPFTSLWDKIKYYLKKS